MGFSPVGAGGFRTWTARKQQYRGLVWDIHSTLGNEKLPRLRLNGEDLRASWIIPESRLGDDRHRIELMRGGCAPTRPILKDVRLENECTVRFGVRGPGGAFMKIWCPIEPRVWIDGQPLEIGWDRSTQTVIAEVSIRREMTHAILVKIDSILAFGLGGL